MLIFFMQQVPQRPLLLRELHVDALMLDIVTSCAAPYSSAFFSLPCTATPHACALQSTGKATSADHCSIEVIRAGGGNGNICLSSEGDSGGAGLCSVSVQAFEKRNPLSILLSLQLQANISSANIHS
jgi:hypothetical protein